VAFRRQVGGLDVSYYATVATGDVLVGQFGHPSKLALDVIGTTVNAAGKLLKEAHASATRCAFCDETAREVGTKV
jgi:class 3 adenylate cyclase